MSVLCLVSSELVPRFFSKYLSITADFEQFLILVKSFLILILSTQIIALPVGGVLFMNLTKEFSKLENFSKEVMNKRFYISDLEYLAIKH